MSQYETVIWLEIHVRVWSKTKFFCGCKNAIELESEPNVNVCPICMWFPGALPVTNAEVVRLWVIAWLAMKCTINPQSRFDRKSYFYPDLPTGFQITQLYEPIVEKGIVKVLVNEEEKEFHIHHMHLENDAWKLIHAWWKTLCDYNRSWSPLMEIVTEPDFRSKEDVMDFLKELQKLLRAANVSQADMEKWQLRCDVNISIRKPWETILNNRVEIKNVNSFSAIGRVIENERERQIQITESGGNVDQQTRGWDDERWESTLQRSKEDAMDYRYFPEPDLMPVQLDEAFVEECAKTIPELPIDRRIRYLSEYKLKPDDARILTLDMKMSDYFDKLVELTNDPKKSCSYITTVLNWLLNESDEINSLSDMQFDIKELAEVIKLVNNDELSSTNSKEVIEKMFNEWGKANEIVDSLWLRQKNDDSLLEWIVEDVVKNFPSQLAEYKSWKEQLFGFFVWQCMKASKWQGNPKKFNDLLKKKL